MPGWLGRFAYHCLENLCKGTYRVKDCSGESSTTLHCSPGSVSAGPPIQRTFTGAAVLGPAASQALLSTTTITDIRLLWRCQQCTVWQQSRHWRGTLPFPGSFELRRPERRRLGRSQTHPSLGPPTTPLAASRLGPHVNWPKAALASIPHHCVPISGLDVLACPCEAFRPCWVWFDHSHGCFQRRATQLWCSLSPLYQMLRRSRTGSRQGVPLPRSHQVADMEAPLMDQHRRVSPGATEVASPFRGHCRHRPARQRLGMSLLSRLVAVATGYGPKGGNAQLQTRSLKQVLVMLVA